MLSSLRLASVCCRWSIVAIVVSWLVAFALPALAADPAGKPSREAVTFFENEVRPLLAAKCFKCHGEEKQSGSLRLDTPEGLFGGGETGPAVEPGKPAESLLIEAINYESYEMPPTGKLADEEIAVLTRWVSLGAPWPNYEPGAARPAERGEKISAEDRAWWSFQPLAKVTPPPVDDAGWGRNPIDAFLFEKQAIEGLRPSSEADRGTLLRRVKFALHGLPPTTEEIAEFTVDNDPQAYERLIDRLLDSPLYGQRWARHWLDLVRYAESDGWRQDAYRPLAWRYRDWVIDALNQDLPYGEFVAQQLAGDELAPDDPQALVATGFLRHGLYEYNQRDVRTQWSEIVNDITDTTADVFLGMGVSCARCHDHKFDPLLQQDYFRLQAFFAGIELRNDVVTATPAEKAAYERRLAQWEAATQEVRDELAALEAPYLKKAAQSAIKKFPPDIQEILRKPVSERTPHERQLGVLGDWQIDFEYSRAFGGLKGEEKERRDALLQKLATFASQQPAPLPVGMGVRDVGPEAAPTFVVGGRSNDPVEPGYFTVFEPGPAEISPLPGSTGRRATLAAWITRPDHPLTWRVIVNRVWQQHFGRGLVETTSDFGRLGERPSHPELLDWLAGEFLENGQSLKHLHRLILTSAAYRQTSSRPATDLERRVDPQNRLVWRMNVRRLDAEQARDALLAASGELDLKAGGASVAATTTRRSIYTKQQRNSPDPLLKAFDAATGFGSTATRNVTTTPTQSLLLINGAWPLSRAEALAKTLGRAASGNEEAMIRQAYLRVFGRQPTQEEIDRDRRFLAEQTARAGGGATAGQLVNTSPFPSRTGSAVALEENQEPLVTEAPRPMTQSGLTVEAFVLLQSVYADATVRTIVAHWNGDQQQRGWSLGVTSTQSKYTPRNVIMQLVGDGPNGELLYEVVPSGLFLELNTPYFVAVTLPPADAPNAREVTFFSLRLDDNEASLQTAVSPRQTTGGYEFSGPLAVAGRPGQAKHRWHGLIDEVRLAQGVLSPARMLLEGDERPAGLLAWWRFEADPDPLADASPAGRQLRRDGGASAAGAQQTALVDYCHALLNSNEFYYLD